MSNKLGVAAIFISFFFLAGCGDNNSASPATSSAGAAAGPAAPVESAATTPVPKGDVKQLDPAVLASALSTGAACSLDTIDSSYSKDQIKLDRSNPHVFRGWLLDEAKQPAGNFSVVLKGPQDYAIPASTGEIRKDVGDYFKDPALSAAGFSVSAVLSTVQAGDYEIKFIIQKAGHTYFCDAGKKLSLS